MTSCPWDRTRPGTAHSGWLLATVSLVRVLGGLLLLSARGLLLWVLIPAAVLAWLVTRAAGRRETLGQVLGWADLNLIASLQRILPRPLVASRQAFVPWREVSRVTHRIRALDPA